MRKFGCIFVGELDLILFPLMQTILKVDQLDLIRLQNKLVEEKKIPQTPLVEVEATSANHFEC